jgi:hypothetical protein
MGLSAAFRKTAHRHTAPSREPQEKCAKTGHPPRSRSSPAFTATGERDKLVSRMVQKIRQVPVPRCRASRRRKAGERQPAGERDIPAFFCEGNASRIANRQSSPIPPVPTAFPKNRTGRSAGPDRRRFPRRDRGRAVHGDWPSAGRRPLRLHSRNTTNLRRFRPCFPPDAPPLTAPCSSAGSSACCAPWATSCCRAAPCTA